MEQSKIHIYQLLVRLFGNKKTKNQPWGTIQTNGCGKFNDINNAALDSIKELGFSHVWFTGILEHASESDYSDFHISGDNPAILKGKAGSPYSVRDYYDVSPDLAKDVNNRMREFELLLNRTHKNGLKAIIDFIPNHVSRAYYSDNKPSGVDDFGEHDDTLLPFHPQNNFYYVPNEPLHLPTAGTFEEFPAKATGNDCFHAWPGINDWYETVKLNYGIDYQNGNAPFFDPIPSTWIKMRDILLFWAAKGVDGFRCDMAEMVPVEFWGWTIPQIKAQYPNIIFVAEVYNPDLYRAYIHDGKFDFLYDKVGMYDTLRALMENNQSASALTQEWQKVEDIIDHMLYFLENHDEQRIASDFFAKDPIKGIPATAFLTCLNRSPYLLYSGQEVGEKAMESEGFSGIDGRTSIFDYWGVKSLQNWMNGGKFDGKRLSPEQHSLRETYQSILNFALYNDTIQHGDFYDLQYANYENPNFNGNQLFSFLRYGAKEKIWMIINFSSSDMYFKINIPQEATETALWKRDKKMNVEMIDFSISKKSKESLDEVIKDEIRIKGNSALVYRFY